MTIKSNDYSYGALARFFHWSTAILILLSYCSVYYRQWFTDDNTDANWISLQIHLSVGISIGVVLTLRILWRLFDNKPASVLTNKIEKFSAKLGHYVLYIAIVLAFITGYLGTGLAIDFFFLFEIPAFMDTHLFNTTIVDRLGLTFEEFEKPIDFFHKIVLGKWLIWIIVLGHIAAALYHHYYKQDLTLRKML